MKPTPSKKVLALAGGGIAVGLLLTGCGSDDPRPMACADLNGLAIPASAIGLPTTGGTVTSAAVVAATAAVPEHCLVNASISPVDSTAPKILLGVTGGIAAYKSPELVRRLVERGCRVQVVMSRGAQAFVSPVTFQAVSGRRGQHPHP